MEEIKKKAHVFKNWSFENYFLLIFLIVLFLISVSALLVSLLTYKRPVSSDLSRNVTFSDGETAVSMSAAKILHDTLINVQTTQINFAKTLGNIMCIQNDESTTTTSVFLKKHIEIFGKNFKLAEDSSICKTYKNSSSLFLTIEINITAVEFGNSDASIVINLENVIEKKFVLLSTASILTTSTNDDDVISWNKVVPEIVENTIVLNNSQWYVTSNNDIKLLVFISANTKI
jgi:hypothetical protein